MTYPICGGAGLLILIRFKVREKERNFDDVLFTFKVY